MKINYTWDILQFVAKVHEDNLENVVFAIDFKYIGTTSDDLEPNKNYSSFYSAQLMVEYNPDNPFTPFEDLTKDQVTQWLIDGSDIEFMQEFIAKNIELQKNPVDVYLSPTWNDQV
jgi:hypothetical protein